MRLRHSSLHFALVLALCASGFGCGDDSSSSPGGPTPDGSIPDADGGSPVSDAESEELDAGDLEAGDSDAHPDAQDSSDDAELPARHWGPAVVLSEDAGTICGIDVAVDAIGNALVVWGRCQAGLASVWSARFTAGAGWGAAERIDASQDAQSLQGIELASNANGDAVVVWGEQSASASSLWANRFSPSSGWVGPEALGPTAGYRPSVAMDHDANAIAAWTDAGIVVRVLASGTWGAPVQLHSGNARDPSASMSPTGTGIVVWSQTESVGSHIWSSRYSLGGGWGAAEVVDDTPEAQDTLPTLRFLSDGSAIAAWTRTEQSWWMTIAKRFVEGPGWGAGAARKLTQAMDAPTPVLSADASGQAFLLVAHNGKVSGCGQSSVSNVCATVYSSASGTWGQLAEVDQSTSDVNAPRVAAWGDGAATALWTQSLDLYAGTHTQSGWSARELLASGAIAAEIATNSQGLSVAAWSTTQSGTGSVSARRLE